MDHLWQRIASAGFDTGRPAIVASTGVSMYLTKKAIEATLGQVAMLAPGSTLVMTFLMPLELAEPELRPALEFALKGARASGTPFNSFFTPEEMLSLARDAGFKARVGRNACRALLLRQDGWLASTKECRGTAGRGHLSSRRPQLPLQLLCLISSSLLLCF